MYAVIATGGKQYRVQKDDVIDIERLEGEVGAKVTFDEVLLVGEGTGIECGTPLLKSAKVTAEIVDQFRGKKLTVFKMKRRKGYRKKHGHRQELTKVKITDISAGSKAKAEKVTAE
jgi:large subunit ribosomal protein L21